MILQGDCIVDVGSSQYVISEECAKMLTKRFGRKFFVKGRLFIIRDKDESDSR